MADQTNPALTGDALQIQTIKTTLNSVEYPITASYIEKISGLPKSAVNKHLYAKQHVDFDQLPCVPPLWRIHQ